MAPLKVVIKANQAIQESKYKHIKAKKLSRDKIVLNKKIA